MLSAAERHDLDSARADWNRFASRHRTWEGLRFFCHGKLQDYPLATLGELYGDLINKMVLAGFWPVRALKH